MRFLFISRPQVGHITPMLPIVVELISRGHEVLWYSGRGFQPRIEATGARFAPIERGEDESVTPPAPLPPRYARQNLASATYVLSQHIPPEARNQFLDLQDLLKSYPADLLVSDVSNLGASWIHDSGGPPYAILGIVPLSLSSRDTAPHGLARHPGKTYIGRRYNKNLTWLTTHVFLRSTITALDEARRSVGLSPKRQWFADAVGSPFLYLQGTVPAFEYPRRDLPPHVHFVGPFQPATDSASCAGFTPPDWWSDLTGSRPVIHVTQGTMATDAKDLILPTLQALATEDILVVATTGGKDVAEVSLPVWAANARLAAFIPHAALLPHVDLMITNGGYNGVQAALAHGIPLISAGTHADKPEVGARIAWAGVGINLKTATPTPAQIRTAVKAILSSPHYKAKAQQIQAEIAKHTAYLESAQLLEQLAETKQPVLCPTSSSSRVRVGNQER